MFDEIQTIWTNGDGTRSKPGPFLEARKLAVDTPDDLFIVIHGLKGPYRDSLLMFQLDQFLEQIRRPLNKEPSDDELAKWAIDG